MSVLRRFGWTAGLQAAYATLGVSFGTGGIVTTSSYRHLTNTGLGSAYGFRIDSSPQIGGIPAGGRWICFDAGSVSGSGGVSWTFRIGGTDQFSVVVTAAGAIELRRGSAGGTVVASAAAGTVIIGNFYWFSIELVAQDAGGSCSVYLGAATAPVVTYSGDTQNAGSPGWDAVGATGFNWRWNDIVVDTADRWSEFFSVGLVPTSDSSNTGFTASTGATNWGVVDEVPWSTSDYTGGTANNDEFRCGHGSLPAGVSPVGATLISYFARDGTIADINLVVSSGGTDSYGGPQAGGSSGAYVMLHAYRDTDPNTGLAWTAGAINASLIGARIET